MAMGLRRLKLLVPKVGKLPPGINFIDIAAWHWILHVRMPCCFTCVWLFATHWTAACQAPLSMRFPRQEYWTGLPCPPPWDLPNSETEASSLLSLHWQSGSWPLVPPGKPDTDTYPCLNPCTRYFTDLGDWSHYQGQIGLLSKWDYIWETGVHCNW